MAPQPKKRTRRGTRMPKTRARGARPKGKRPGARGRAKRPGARSKPNPTRRRSRKSVGRARSRRTEETLEAPTFEERFTPEDELAKRAADAMVGDEEPGGSVS